MDPSDAATVGRAVIGWVIIARAAAINDRVPATNTVAVIVGVAGGEVWIWAIVIIVRTDAESFLAAFNRGCRPAVFAFAVGLTWRNARGSTHADITVVNVCSATPITVAVLLTSITGCGSTRTSATLVDDGRAAVDACAILCTRNVARVATNTVVAVIKECTAASTPAQS